MPQKRGIISFNGKVKEGKLYEYDEPYLSNVS